MKNFLKISRKGHSPISRPSSCGEEDTLSPHFTSFGTFGVSILAHSVFGVCRPLIFFHNSTIGAAATLCHHASDKLRKINNWKRRLISHMQNAIYSKGKTHRSEHRRLVSFCYNGTVWCGIKWLQKSIYVTSTIHTLSPGGSSEVDACME